MARVLQIALLSSEADYDLAVEKANVSLFGGTGIPPTGGHVVGMYEAETTVVDCVEEPTAHGVGGLFSFYAQYVKVL